MGWWSAVCGRYIQLLGVVPTDALIEKRLGEMFDADGEKTDAFTYFYNVNHFFVLKCLICTCPFPCLAPDIAEVETVHMVHWRRQGGPRGPDKRINVMFTSERRY